MTRRKASSRPSPSTGRAKASHRPLSSVPSAGGGVAEALLWFHLERQLRDGLTPAEYSVQEVTTDHESPQRWHGHELPKVASINKAVITRVMAKEYAPEIEAYRQRGGFLYEG